MLDKECNTKEVDHDKADRYQGEPEDPTIDESREAKKKFHKVLLLYWCIIHNGNSIIPVLVVPSVFQEVQERSKQFHKALQEEGTSNQETKGMQLPEMHLSLATSQFTEAIIAISLSIEDANKVNKRDSLTNSKEKEEAE